MQIDLYLKYYESIIQVKPKILLALDHCGIQLLKKIENKYYCGIKYIGYFSIHSTESSMAKVMWYISGSYYIEFATCIAWWNMFLTFFYWMKIWVI